MQPGAYLTDELRLFEVRNVRSTHGPFGPQRTVRLVDQKTFGTWVLAITRVCREMRLIRRAPSCPTTPESLLRKEQP